MSGKIDVSILIVGFNSRRFLAAMMQSIAPAANQTSYEVLFVNNGTDRSELWVAKAYPEVKVLPSLGNIGFGAANNYLAKSASGSWLLLINPDTELFPGSIEELLQATALADDYSVFGGISEDAEGRPLDGSRLAFPTFLAQIKGLIGIKSDRNPIFDDGDLVSADAVSGGFMLVDHSVWHDLGGFDETYFLYAEELDFCRRLHQIGGKVASFGGARIYHDVGAGDHYSPSRQFYLHCGLATYFRKHLSWPHRYACLGLQWLRSLLRFVAGGLLSPFDERCSRMALAHKDISLRPWRWMPGYPERP